MEKARFETHPYFFKKQTSLAKLRYTDHLLPAKTEKKIQAPVRVRTMRTHRQLGHGDQNIRLTS